MGVDDDDTTKVSVKKGEVDVKAQGRKVTVLKGFRTIVEKGEEPQSPVGLPINGEEALKFKETGEEAPEVNFKLQVSKSRVFNDTLKDEVTTNINPDYIKKELSPGQYYWRVAIIDKEGFTGDFSRPRSIYVSSKVEGFLELNKFEVVNKEEGIMRITGLAKNVSRVSVNGYPANLKDNGSFSATIILNPGQELITVSSFGESGIILRKYHRSPEGMWLPAR